MMAGRDTYQGDVAGGLARHIPVMLPEVLEALSPRDDEVYVDGTFGAGGYSAAVLEAAACVVVALDRDPVAIVGGARLAEAYPERLVLRQGRFSEMAEHVAAAGFGRVDGVMLDIGVSSMQLDEAERGFSFSADGPLDMRMEQSGPSAADVVNGLGEKELAAVIWLLGEEKRSRAIAKAIVKQRAERRFTRTGELADLVARVLGGRREAKHPATRTFQALRVFVNRELDELVKGLFAAEEVLKEGGRLVVVSFHSLEDRIVKRFLAAASATSAGVSRHRPERTVMEPAFTLLKWRGSAPDAAQIAANPRSRSARLRAAVRTAAPARPVDTKGLGLPGLPELPRSFGGVAS